MDVSFLATYSASELVRVHKSREVSPVETLEACLNAIESLDADVNATILVTRDEALEQAKAIERRLARGSDVGALAGVPYGLKDVIDVAGLPTTGGSNLYREYRASRSSPLASRLAAAGAVHVAKLNTMEFNYGDEWNSYYGPTRNPWDLDCYSGGSSAGPAGAVAARMLPFTIGEDTGGSIRLPCSNSGISGLKPTYGRIPRTGMMGVAWSMDQPGPMARTVEDVALVMSVVSGHDPGDPMSSKRFVPDYLAELERPLSGVRVGVPKLWFESDAQVLKAYEQALRELEGEGAILVDVEFPLFELTPGIAWSIITTEFSALHEVTRDRIDEYGELMAVRLVLGEFVTGVDYLRAQRLRHVMQLECEEVFRNVDIVVTPTTPSTAGRFKDHDCVVEINGSERPWIEESPKPTQPFSLTGLPAASVPCGFSSDGMPIGLQLAGRPHADSSVLAVAHAYQQLHEYHSELPPLVRDSLQ